MRLARILTAAALAALLGTSAYAQAPAGMTTPAQHTATAPAASAPLSGKLVDINSASPAELDALPGIGKARTASIIKNRPYRGKDDLLNKHILPSNVYNGIKDKIIAKQS